MKRLWFHLISFTPAFWLFYLWMSDDLGFEPIREATLITGKTALVFLLFSLSCTPVGFIFRQDRFLVNSLNPKIDIIKSGLSRLVYYYVKTRRALGLYSFFYATLHMMLFFVIDYELNLDYIREAVLKKPYALVGVFAYILLLVLALTSSKKSKNILGKNWKKLHRIVFLAGAAATVHFIWLVKSDYREPLVYGAIFVLLIVIRILKIQKNF